MSKLQPKGGNLMLYKWILSEMQPPLKNWVSLFPLKISKKKTCLNLLWKPGFLPTFGTARSVLTALPTYSHLSFQSTRRMYLTFVVPMETYQCKCQHLHQYLDNTFRILIIWSTQEATTTGCPLVPLAAGKKSRMAFHHVSSSMVSFTIVLDHCILMKAKKEVLPRSSSMILRKILIMN